MAHKLGTGGREWREGEVMVQVSCTRLDVVCRHGELEDESNSCRSQSDSQTHVSSRVTEGGLAFLNFRFLSLIGEILAELKCISNRCYRETIWVGLETDERQTRQRDRNWKMTTYMSHTDIDNTPLPLERGSLVQPSWPGEADRAGCGTAPCLS